MTRTSRIGNHEHDLGSCFAFDSAPARAPIPAWLYPLLPDPSASRRPRRAGRIFRSSTKHRPEAPAAPNRQNSSVAFRRRMTALEAKARVTVSIRQLLAQLTALSGKR